MLKNYHEKQKSDKEISETSIAADSTEEAFTMLLSPRLRGSGIIHICFSQDGYGGTVNNAE